MTKNVWNWQDRRVLLTGASSGIGRALAIELGRRGAVLAVVARRGDLLDEVGTQIVENGGARPTNIVVDLSQRDSGRVAADRALDSLGRIDVVVNNAGGGVGGLQEAVSDGDAAREAFEVNFWTPIQIISTLLPHLRRADGARVVNVTSLGQVMVGPGLGHYCATKAALAATTEALRLELTNSGIGVTEVVVGPTDTPVQGETRLAPGADGLLKAVPLGAPEVLARRIADGVARGRATIVYPRHTVGAYLLPSLSRRYIRARVRRLWPGGMPEDDRVIRSGSHGDPEAVRAREQWSETRAHPGSGHATT